MNLLLIGNQSINAVNNQLLCEGRITMVGLDAYS